jgi:hypothetical protein
MASVSCSHQSTVYREQVMSRANNLPQTSCVLKASCFLLLLLLGFTAHGLARDAKAEAAAKSFSTEDAIVALEKVGAKFERDEAGNIFGIRLLGNQIKNESLAYLNYIPRLKRLTIMCALDMTDEGLVHLANLTELEYLWFGYAPITDQGMKHLTKLSKLRELHLGIFTRSKDGSPEQGFQDAGLVYLKELKSLRKLTYRNTKLTDEAVDDLRKALPDCEIKSGS